MILKRLALSLVFFSTIHLAKTQHAYPKELPSGMRTAEIQTQKTLVVQSNAPRFMREGDKMEFSTRITNKSNKELTGQITLELIDATTNTSVDGWFQNIFPTQ